ncbi:IPT/TIG domain-containing protein, partial [Streptomyces kronopolitis]|uniref:YncE family protein n=1 Tax=Streptomyces kronopolitis TaxID=1612435 RepID=UPI00369E9B25
GTVPVTVTTPLGTSNAVNYTYAAAPAAPVLNAVVPNTGPAAGTNTVLLVGTGFTGATAVNFGPNPATSFTVNSDTQITAVVPAGTGTVPVTVTTPLGTSNAVNYTYAAAPAAPVLNVVMPNTGPLTGGNTVLLVGTGFTGATAVNFGPNPATSFTVISDTQISAVAPAGSGTVAVTVTTPLGTSNAVNYTYQDTGTSNCTVAVPNSNLARVSYFNTQTLTITGSPTAVGSTPWRVAASTTAPFAYVTNNVSNTVSVIDTNTNTVIATIPVGSGPEGLAVTPNGAKIYVANNVSHTVSVINTANNTVIATIPVAGAPVQVAVSPNGTRAYVVLRNIASVAVIDTATDTVIATIPVGAGPYGVTFSPNGTQAYVVNGTAGTVSVINTATNTVTATIPGIGTGQFSTVAVTPNGTRAYVTNTASNTVSVINTATNTVIATIPGFAGPNGVLISPDGTRAYVGNTVSNTVSVINTATNTVIATIPGFSEPGEMAFIRCCGC